MSILSSSTVEKAGGIISILLVLSRFLHLGFTNLLPYSDDVAQNVYGDYEGHDRKDNEENHMCIDIFHLDRQRLHFCDHSFSWGDFLNDLRGWVSSFLRL